MVDQVIVVLPMNTFKLAVKLADTNDPTLRLPDTPKLPVILAPVSVTTNDVLPPAVKLILPLAVGIAILLVPLLNVPVK